jgi:predicted transcriptional regulator
MTKEHAGISRTKFQEYFEGCKTAYAYCLGETTKYGPPKELAEFNIKQPPQSFIYLPDVVVDEKINIPVSASFVAFETGS